MCVCVPQKFVPNKAIEFSVGYVHGFCFPLLLSLAISTQRKTKITKCLNLITFCIGIESVFFLNTHSFSMERTKRAQQEKKNCSNSVDLSIMHHTTQILEITILVSRKWHEKA